MKRDYYLSLMMLALFGLATPFAADVFAESVPSSYTTQQARKITGRVVDVSGEPIIGASVLVKGSGTGAVTDIDGNFTVNASVGSTLEISFIGYKAATVKVTNASSYAITLQDDSQALDEVVVTAMGIKK
ncbi:carboxypeptidase-like regulatory domain-containing protein, partial [Bacteroides heparinolyticus]